MGSKRWLSLVMAAFMLFTLIAPALAWASEGDEDETTQLYRLTITVEPAHATVKVYGQVQATSGSAPDYAHETPLSSYAELPAGAYLTSSRRRATRPRKETSISRTPINPSRWC